MNVTSGRCALQNEDIEIILPFYQIFYDVRLGIIPDSKTEEGFVGSINSEPRKRMATFPHELRLFPFLVPPLGLNIVRSCPEACHGASARTLNGPARSELHKRFGDEQGSNIEEYLGGLYKLHYLYYLPCCIQPESGTGACAA